MLGCTTKSRDRHAQKHDGQTTPLLAQLRMPDKERLFFFQRYHWNHCAHSFCKSGPSTSLALRLSKHTPLPSRDTYFFVPGIIHSERRKKAGLQRFFLKQEVAVIHWSLQLNPAKTDYQANASSTCHACLPSQPSPEAVLAPRCLALAGSFCRFPTPSPWQAFHCCYCRVPGFVLVKAGTNMSWI